MFAHGTGPCAKVDLVTGPGNIWTVTANGSSRGLVGIDSEAGRPRSRSSPTTPADAALRRG